MPGVSWKVDFSRSSDGDIRHGIRSPDRFNSGHECRKTVPPPLKWDQIAFLIQSGINSPVSIFLIWTACRQIRPVAPQPVPVLFHE